MHIGIDIRVLGSEFKSGIQEYTEQLLEHMLPLRSDVRFSLFYSSYSYPLRDYVWMEHDNVHVMRARIPNQFLTYTGRFLGVPRIDKLLGGVDVFFSPHILLAPLSRSCPRVTTFHDLAFERFPEFFSWRQRMWHALMQPKWQARFSDAIIAVSESTKRDIVWRYDIDEQKIHCIHSGLSPSLTRPVASALEAFKARYAIPDKFILFLGTLEPRKNVEGIIRAFSLLRELHGFEDVVLLIAGPRGWLYESIFWEMKHLGNSVRFINFIADAERPYYYSLASLLIYPSFFEGFGFPPLEAMACGTPVIASQQASLPEIIDDAGLSVNPYSIAEITEAMKTILSDRGIREQLVKKGLERIQHFSWKKSARQTLDLLMATAK